MFGLYVFLLFLFLLFLLHLILCVCVSGISLSLVCFQLKWSYRSEKHGNTNNKTGIQPICQYVAKNAKIHKILKNTNNLDPPINYSCPFGGPSEGANILGLRCVCPKSLNILQWAWLGLDEKIWLGHSDHWKSHRASIFWIPPLLHERAQKIRLEGAKQIAVPMQARSRCSPQNGYLTDGCWWFRDLKNNKTINIM